MAKFDVMMEICNVAILVQEFNIYSWKRYTIKYYNAPHRENDIFIVIKGVGNDYVCELDKSTCKVKKACSRYEEFKEEESLKRYTEAILTKTCGLSTKKLQLIINFVEEFEKKEV